MSSGLAHQMQIFEETTSHAVRQSCEVWRGAFWFGIPVGDGPPGRIGLRALERSDIAVRPGGMEFELMTPSSFRILWTGRRKATPAEVRCRNGM